jgi:hypothetical protein
MENIQTVQPETLLVLRDGELDDEYYDAVYKQKRIEALKQCREELIVSLIGLPAKVGRAVVVVAQHMVEA